MLQRPKGTSDVRSPDVEIFQGVEALFRTMAARFGFSEIRTPTFEATELFLRGAGATSDIVRKEMYTFSDRAGRSLTLRPESTASVVRAYIESKALGLAKYAYIQAHFRYEKPQKGRLREHHQFGLETLGAASPIADAEIIDFLFAFLGEAGLRGLSVALNSIGDEACRPAYRAALVAFFTPRRDELCGDCRARLETNPLRILDCKEEGCASHHPDVPKSTDHLCDACRQHFDGLLEALAELGHPYTLDHRIVRGIDYYTRTVFEISHASLGAQSALCGGGRYDGLSELLGGPPLPGVGFGMGVERLVMTLEAMGRTGGMDLSRALYVALPDASLAPVALREAAKLRRRGLTIEVDLTGRSLKGQLRTAQKDGYGFAAVLGPKEAEAGEAVVRDMTASTQEAVSLVDLGTYLEGRQ